MYGMRAYLHAPLQHRADLLPVQIGGPANLARNNVEHAAKTVRLQHGKSEMKSVIIAIIKGQNNGM